jgi:16S rRNA (adenine1518-N6/adenine1519-N6)-dimethyltransferase
MADLGSAAKTAGIIKKYGFSFQKRFGQNFLIDEHVLDKIIDAANIGEDDGVIEIGPGIGTMTQRLCERAAKVVAIEIDRELIPILEETLSAYENAKVINADVMKTDLQTLIKEEFGNTNVKVVANLPYYITTPIIMMFLEQYAQILRSLTFMVQKEVARRLVSPPGSGEYGAISVAVAYYSSASVCFDVPASCFVPRPKVDSSVVNMSVYSVPPVVPRSSDNMFRLVKAAFSQRRKMLVNAISNAALPGVTKERVTDALDSLSISPSVRGEMLGVKEFAALSDILFDH